MKIEIDGQEYLTVEGAAKLLKFHPASIRRLVSSGKFRPLHIGGMDFFRLKALESYRDRK